MTTEETARRSIRRGRPIALALAAIASVALVALSAIEKSFALLFAAGAVWLLFGVSYLLWFGLPADESRRQESGKGSRSPR